MSTRSALIQFQRRIFSDLRTEVEENLGPLPRSFQRYYEDYRKEFFRFQSLTSMPELLEKIKSCNIVYCGDYHSLRQAQMTNLSLLREISDSRDVVLTTELVYSEDQEILDRYLRDEVDDEKFLRSIDYHRSFGFDWENYKPIFDFARERMIPVIAIDSRVENDSTDLYERDRFMAKTISRAVLRYPDCLIWVMIGDLHLAQTHLPRFVEKELAGKNLERKILILHQNNENLFWKVARQGLHGNVDIIKMNNQMYCILNTPPWMKLYSYVSWLENEDCDARAQDQFLRLLTSLSEFLSIQEPKLFDFVLHSGNDCSFLSEFASGSGAYKYCKRRFEKRQPFLIPGSRIIYLPYPDLDLSAEMASRYIHIVCSGYRPKVGSWKDEFVRRICHIALGFVGSKILNHHRKAPATSRQELQASFSPSKVCSHYGSLMGERIYAAMLAEKIDVKDLRQFYYDPFFEPGSGKRLYMRFSPLD